MFLGSAILSLCLIGNEKSRMGALDMIRGEQIEAMKVALTYRTTASQLTVHENAELSIDECSLDATCHIY
jgi:hypothetical protein